MGAPLSLRPCRTRFGTPEPGRGAGASGQWAGPGGHWHVLLRAEAFVGRWEVLPAEEALEAMAGPSSAPSSAARPGGGDEFLISVGHEERPPHAWGGEAREERLPGPGAGPARCAFAFPRARFPGSRQQE
ncbi:hypothetical protein DUI87_18064 [Hirundo rustica rustica]|uniref:Uncharacterized protein n=1 Tax=Hirundo rustica rustica TaxID=333673 RepID=A0A3M0JVN0_HIRRU|nr:hypothetical protein DUI87_18064 [Hirundo rustica rustica]